MKKPQIDRKPQVAKKKISALEMIILAPNSDAQELWDTIVAIIIFYS